MNRRRDERHHRRTRSPTAQPRRPTAHFTPHHDALDGQRRLRPRQQRRLLQLLRHARSTRYLIERGALDIHAGTTIGLVVETHCNYFAPLAFPQTVEAGLRVARVGTLERALRDRPVRRRGAPLRRGRGHFVHVYVDRATRRPVSELPPALQAALRPLAT